MAPPRTSTRDARVAGERTYRSGDSTALRMGRRPRAAGGPVFVVKESSDLKELTVSEATPSRVVVATCSGAR